VPQKVTYRPCCQTNYALCAGSYLVIGIECPKVSGLNRRFRPIPLDMEVKEDVVQPVVVAQVPIVGGDVGVPLPSVIVVVGVNEVGLADAVPTGGALWGCRSPIAAAIGCLGDEDGAGGFLHFWFPQGRIHIPPLVAFPVPVLVATHVVMGCGRGAGDG